MHLFSLCFRTLSFLRPRLAVSLALGLVALSGGHAFAAATSTSTFTAPSTPAVRLNEVLASNTRIANAGTFPDIIELHNSSAAAVDLTGRSLTDDPLLPLKFVFPSGTSIAAGGYLLVYADAASSAPGLHAGFSLDAEGDQVRLYERASSGGALLDSIAFGFQAADFSVARTGTSANVWTLTAPTPGAVNGPPATLGSPDALKINEWAGKIQFRLDHDLIELFNTAAQPVALGGVKLTDDPARPDRFKFPALSFMAGGGFLALYGADFSFGLDGDVDPIFLFGENGSPIDNVNLAGQPADYSSGRNPDGGSSITNYAVPTPGLSNQTPVPAGHAALLNSLRITEIMYQPAAPSNPGDYEFIELHNIGATTLDLSGVRFTNGMDYTFPPGTTLAAGAFIVVARNRSTFLSRYPSATNILAPGAFAGALDNSGETLTLTLPAPWNVHVLRFRFEADWFASASGGGNSLVIPAPATTPAVNWRDAASWRASAAVNGSPGQADAGGAVASAARLINLSILTALPASGDSFTMGYVVGGAGTSGVKRLVIRAAGPSLGALGVPGTLDDPKMELFAGPTKTGENDNWGGAAVTTSAMAGVGAFPYVSPTSRDAAAVVDIATRDNSVKVSATGSGTGTVIAEIYDATPAASMTATTPRLLNVSVIKPLGTGFTAGFVVGGTGTRNVLVRAVGPTLNTAFGLNGVVSDPQITLYSGQNVIGTNDNWGGTTALTATFGQVGAFVLPATSRDAALAAPLAPGDYSVVVRGVDGATGTVLVEVYEVP